MIRLCRSVAGLTALGVGAYQLAGWSAVAAAMGAASFLAAYLDRS